MTEEKTNKKDFVEIKFTGYLEGKVFDSNISEDLTQLSKDIKPEKTIVCIGEQMVVPGLDNALEDKTLKDEHKIDVPYKDGFGLRNRDLVKTIPLSVFTKQKINPQIGASLWLDNKIARVITISGARVLTDFNNPLAGKDIKYKFKITRFVTEGKEKAEALFKFYIKFIPEFEIKDSVILIKGQKVLEGVVDQYKSKFKEILGLDLKLQVKEEKKQADETPL
jgi:FKBP-type peptidyl-prolyl cis-trans isomerase 2